MQAIVRNYTRQNAVALFDLPANRSADVHALMAKVNGLSTVLLAHTAAGGFTATVCHDRAGIDERIRLAKAWIAPNAVRLSVSPPEVSVGVVGKRRRGSGQPRGRKNVRR